MRTSKIWATTLLVCCTLFAASACGGGGGGGILPPQPPPDGDGDAVTKAVIEDCLPDALDAMLRATESLQAMLAGNGSSVGASIAPGGLDDTETTGRIAWEVDSDATFPPDLSGELFLTDGAGGAVPPITSQDVTDLMNGGIDALGAIVLGLPDGTGLQVTWNHPPPAIADGQLIDAVSTGGVFGITDGLFNADDGTCLVGMEWDDVPLAQLRPSFPTATLRLLITSGTDVLDGSLTTQGTRTATIVVSRNGGANASWSYDLVTGVATAP